MRLIDADALGVGRCSRDVLPAEYCAGWNGLIRLLEKAPTVDAVPVVHGRWIEDHDYLKCPECGVMVKWDFTFFDIGNWNYCPNCGAKMDIEDGGDNNAAD